MKRWKKALVWTISSVLVVVLLVLALMLWGMRPTSGPKIANYPVPQTALLIIDIQEDYTGPKAQKPYHDGENIVTVSNALLAQAQAKGFKTLFIQNVIDNPVVALLTSGINAPGAPGTEMDRRLSRSPGTKTFVKKRSDAFSSDEFDAYLRENQVDHVMITGLDAAYCINATVHGALNRGYKVTVFLDGIATESGKSIETLAQGWREAGVTVKKGREL